MYNHPLKIKLLQSLIFPHLKSIILQSVVYIMRWHIIMELVLLRHVPWFNKSIILQSVVYIVCWHSTMALVFLRCVSWFDSVVVVVGDWWCELSLNTLQGQMRVIEHLRIIMPIYNTVLKDSGLYLGSQIYIKLMTEVW